MLLLLLLLLSLLPMSLLLFFATANVAAADYAAFFATANVVTAVYAALFAAAVHAAFLLLPLLLLLFCNWQFWYCCLRCVLATANVVAAVTGMLFVRTANFVAAVEFVLLCLPIVIVSLFLVIPFNYYSYVVTLLYI